MRITALIALALLGSCSSAPEHPRFPDVRPRLVLLDPAPAVGTPLRVRLELVNDGDAAVLYDAQGSNCNGSIRLLGSDGRSVPFIDGPRSTGGSFQELAPKSSIALIDETDLTRQYLVSKPGRYTIRFGGYIRVVDAAQYSRLEKEVAGDDRVDYFARLHRIESSVEEPSNTITVEVRPGTVPEKYVVAEKFLAALPDGWEIAVNWWPPQTGDPEYTLFRPNRKKGDSVIVLRLSQGTPLKDERRAGEWRGKNVYIRSSADDEKAWPGHDRRLVEILNGR
jgi:hypothetical protein